MFSGIVAAALILLAPLTQGQSCSSESECNKLISEYESKLGAIRDQKNTLSSQIQFSDTQVYLTTLRIQDAESKIKKTGEEIENISGKIDGLNESLDHVSKLLIEKIAEGYKRRDVPFLNIFVDSNKASVLANRLKYAKTVEENDRRLAFQVQQAKLNFQQQKQLREKKQEQLAQLTKVLEDQKVALDNQKLSKQRLLSETQSDERVYQNLLSQARANLSGFSSFAQAAGGGSLASFGSGSNGWYYTQRDPAWGSRLLPGSSSSLSLAGCAVSSIAMVCKSYGGGETPGSIAADTSRFIGGDLWNWAFGCSGKSTSFLGRISQEDAKSYVKNGTPVILRLSAASISGLHFIVAYSWDDGANDFKVHDPYYGPDKSFTERYNWSQVTNAIVIR